MEDVRGAQNRPLYPEHVSAIKSYLKDNLHDTYILPPMTLNTEQDVNFYCPDYKSDMLQGFVVLPETAKISITDGGHRKTALDEIAHLLSDDDLQELNSHGIPVMITLERDLRQVHQDFADCSKTKELPKSLIAAYDRRNPANGMVLDLIESCELFRNKIDSASKTLSKRSTKLFLTNQVRQMVKELLLPGGYALADDQFEKQAVNLLGSNASQQYRQYLEKSKAYIDAVTEAIPILNRIAQMQPGLSTSQIPSIREKGWVCLMATGLVILGRIGNELMQVEHDADWRDYAARLGELDWTKEGPLWAGTIIQSGKVMTQQSPVREAVKAVRRAIGLEKPDGQAESVNEPESTIDPVASPVS